MPLTPQKIKDRLGHVQFTYADELVNVDYHAALVENLTQAQVERWTEDALALGDDEQKAREFLAGLVVEYVVSWDVLEEIDGPTVPLTIERLARGDISDDFQGDVLMEIVRHANAGKLNGTRSPGTSAAISSPAATTTASLTSVSQ
jgi:hypothetical protein